jgi:hypothetical protein
MMWLQLWIYSFMKKFKNGKILNLNNNFKNVGSSWEINLFNWFGLQLRGKDSEKEFQ